MEETETERLLDLEMRVQTQRAQTLEGRNMESRQWVRV